MWNNLRYSVLIGITVLGLNVIGSGMAASAQQPVRTAPGDAPLVVDGVVRQVFRSARPGRTDFLVEIEVQRSEAKRLPAGTSRIDYPGPGESVYVHVFQRTDAAGQTVRGDGYTSIPEDGRRCVRILPPDNRLAGKESFRIGTSRHPTFLRQPAPPIRDPWSRVLSTSRPQHS